MRKLFRVIKEHKATFSYAFIADKGEKISVSDEDEEMPGWFWCKNHEGVEAWVPKTHIIINGNEAIFNQPYNSIEHNARP